MNAITTLTPADDLETFLPGCAGEDRELRERIRGQRNAMTAMVSTTQSDTARALAWLVIEYASAHLYAAASLERLREVGRFCHRLSLCAMQAEDVDQ